MASATDLPQELCYDPMSFVVLTGLDIKYNAIHKSIWDAFSNNRRADRVPISFGCLPGDHCYPRSKDKRTSYEWYIPKGILKTKWMDKHLHQVPAVVVIYYELDWDEPAWREKQMECASRVEVVRTSLQGRGTKVAVVLIQKSTPLPPGEDMVAAERAAALCSACDLSAKSLFVLPHTDHLLGYIIRLENAFYELANSYYHTEARRVKAHKEFLNKTTHQLLFVRHQFKIGFFNELMQDPANALKHYRQAYTHIHELRSHDTNNLEVKVMGGFVNYKICRLCFLRLNMPLEAISQFRRHVDSFKPKAGNEELMFEHSAWMSKQFTVFGDLFDEAIKAGLAAIQTQHPGFYYQQAAYYAQERRTHAKSLCSVATEQEYPSNDPLDTSGQPLDFYGQRPWRQGHQSIDPPDANKEKDGILALKHQEATIDHSWVIIPLLSSAVAQFKKYKCPRMKRFLTVQMGEEYYHAQDYAKASTLFGFTVWDYRGNKWWDVFNRILILTLRCTYLIANVQQYITTCVELLGPDSRVEEKEKTRIQMNLIRVISGKVPDPEPLTPLDKYEEVGAESDHVEALEAAKHLWAKAMSDPKVYNIELNNLAPFVECKTSFSSANCNANEAVVLHIYLRTSCPFPIRFSQLSVSLGKQVYDEYCVIVDSTLKQNAEGQSELGDLYFEPNKFKHLSFSLPPDQSDVGKSVQVKSIILKLGGDEGANVAILSWNIAEQLAVQDFSMPIMSTKKLLQINAQAVVERWSDIVQIQSCNILHRPPLIEVDISHNAPALINEVYRIRITVKSNEKELVENVRAIVRLEAGQSDEIIHSTFLALDSSSVLSCPSTKALEIEFSNLSSDEQVMRDVYVHAIKFGTRRFSAQVTYDVFDEVIVQKTEKIAHKTRCSCFIEKSVSFDAVPAFELTSKLTGPDFDSFKHVRPGGTFMAAIKLQCQSPWPIEIDSGSIEMKSQVITTANGIKSNTLTGIVLEEGECASDIMCLCCKEDVLFEVMHGIAVGKYSVQWRRCLSEKESLPFVSSSVQLPTATIKKFPLQLEVKSPANGKVRDAMLISYKLLNCSDEPRELEVLCEVAENFMFSGVKLQRCCILPGSDVTLTYGLYPLAAGFQSLPIFRVREIPPTGHEVGQSSDDDILSCSYLKGCIPTTIFVKPADKI
uniref:trafficking protein particle complex subunit 11-like n=1 Tax=Styela clava TaxID=7725 RepID=UPI00193AD0C5|nr:trafficking protein particle complex subunit 11-like [Styela clava]